MTAWEFRITPLDFMKEVIYVVLRRRNLLLICLVYCIYKIVHRIFLRPYFLSPLRVVPGPPKGNLISGTFLNDIREEPTVPQHRWVKQYGPIVRMVGPIGVERLLFMRAEALHKILVTEWLDNPRPYHMRQMLGFVTGYGLLTVTGDEHKHMRKAMNPAFSLANISAQTDMYYGTIYCLIDILKTEIETEQDPSAGKVMHMYDWLSKATLDIICETAFGYKTDSLHNPDNELAHAYHAMVSWQTSSNIAKLVIPMILPGVPRLMMTEWAFKHQHLLRKIPGFSSSCVLLDSMYRIRAISRKMLEEKMLDAAVVGADDTVAKRDIMSILVRARLADKGEGYSMSDDAMVNQVLTFLGAGHETTASGLAWTLWLLSKHPSVQTRLREEVTPVIADNQHPNYRTLKEFQWLDCVVMESLRVLPPVPMTLRRASKDQIIDGVRVPNGAFFYIPIKIVNTWTELWGDDAEEFKPERWLNLPKEYNPNLSLLSFLAGPHACIGKTMAIIEMKAVLASIIAKFEFEPGYPGQVPKPTAAITMKPADSMPLRVRLAQPKTAV